MQTKCKSILTALAVFAGQSYFIPTCGMSSYAIFEASFDYINKAIQVAENNCWPQGNINRKFMVFGTVITAGIILSHFLLRKTLHAYTKTQNKNIDVCSKNIDAFSNRLNALAHECKKIHNSLLCKQEQTSSNIHAITSKIKNIELELAHINQAIAQTSEKNDQLIHLEIESLYNNIAGILSQIKTLKIILEINAKAQGKSAF